MGKLSRYRSPNPAATTVELIEHMRELQFGHANVAGEVTLATGTTQTKIYDLHVTGSTVISLTPRSAAAAAIVPWQATNTKGTVTLGHAAPGVDLEYYYTLIG